MTSKAKRIAKQITAKLMKNGYGQQAARLQLRGKNEEDLGGLGRWVIEDIIAEELKRIRLTFTLR